jgi:hypothetical protein
LNNTEPAKINKRTGTAYKTSVDIVGFKEVIKYKLNAIRNPLIEQIITFNVSSNNIRYIVDAI